MKTNVIDFKTRRRWPQLEDLVLVHSEHWNEAIMTKEAYQVALGQMTRIDRLTHMANSIDIRSALVILNGDPIITSQYVKWGG